MEPGSHDAAKRSNDAAKSFHDAANSSLTQPKALMPLQSSNDAAKAHMTLELEPGSGGFSINN